MSVGDQYNQSFNISVFSPTDITTRPSRYWSELKHKLRAEGASELFGKIEQLKMKSSDGKMYLTEGIRIEDIEEK